MEKFEHSLGIRCHWGSIFKYHNIGVGMFFSLNAFIDKTYWVHLILEQYQGRGDNPLRNWKSTYNFELALCTHGSLYIWGSLSTDSTINKSRTSVLTTKKKMSAFKWNCAVQIHVVQGSNVFAHGKHRYTTHITQYLHIWNLLYNVPEKKEL